MVSERENVESDLILGDLNSDFLFLNTKLG